MNTYQTWSTSVPSESIQAANSFAARLEFARRHDLHVTDCMASKVYDAFQLDR